MYILLVALRFSKKIKIVVFLEIDFSLNIPDHVLHQFDLLGRVGQVSGDLLQSPLLTLHYPVRAVTLLRTDDRLGTDFGLH